jgi:hypothetical protein
VTEGKVFRMECGQPLSPARHWRQRNWAGPRCQCRGRASLGEEAAGGRGVWKEAAGAVEIAARFGDLLL